MSTTLRKTRQTNVVITRSREGNEELGTRLKSIGLNPISVDAISIVPPTDWTEVDGRLRRLGSYDWLVFTSATGVRHFGTRMKALSLRLSEGRPKIAAVGRKTAEAVRTLGVEADFVPSSYLTRVLGDELPAKRGSRILLLRAEIADHGLVERLAERGFKVDEAAIYRTVVGKEPNPKVKDANLIVFASPSAVRGFCELLPDDELPLLKKLRAICIGPVTESAAKKRGFVNTVIPKSFTMDAVVDEVARLSHERD